MIIRETLQAQPGLNQIPIKLPPAQGLVIIALQGEIFRKTLKALQNNLTELTDHSYSYNFNTALNKSLNQNIETQQNQAINWQKFTGNNYFDAENQGFGSLVGHDRSAGMETQAGGVSQRTQGSGMPAPVVQKAAMHGTQAPGKQGSEAQQYLTLVFSSDNHEEKDTLVSCQFDYVCYVLYIAGKNDGTI